LTSYSIASCVLLCSLEIPGQPFRASLSGITPCARPIRPIPTANPSVYSFISDKSLVPSSTDLEQGRIHRPSLQSAPRTAEWLYGGTPVLPPLPRRSYSLGLAWPTGGPDLSRQSTIYESTAYIPQARTVPAPSIFSDISASSKYSTVSHQTSAISSTGSTRSSISRQSPLSTMRRADEPEVPIIPDKFKLGSRPLLTHGWSRPAEEAVLERTLTMPAKVAREYPSRYRRPSTNPAVPPLAVRKAKSTATLQQPHQRAYMYTHAQTQQQQQQQPYQRTIYQRPSLSRFSTYENPRPPPQPVPSYDYETLRKDTPIFPAPSLQPNPPHHHHHHHHHQPSPLALALDSAVEIDTHGTDGRLYEPVDKYPDQSAILLAQARAGDTVMGRAGLGASAGMRRKGSRTLVKRRQPGDGCGSGGSGGKRMGMGRRLTGSGGGTALGTGGWLWNLKFKGWATWEWEAGHVGERVRAVS